MLRTLVRAGFISAQRGLHGGFLLACDPHRVSALQVAAAVDPLKRIHSCPLKLAAHRASLCALHRRVDAALARAEALLTATTLAELAGQAGRPVECRPLPVLAASDRLI